MKGKYKFVRFKSLIDGEEAKKWWFAAKSGGDVIEHAEKFLVPTMQEGFNSASKDAIDAIFKFGDVKYIQWTGGYHWYAKVNKEDAVDELGNQKWNTKKEAEEAAKWYITKYY